MVRVSNNEKVDKALWISLANSIQCPVILLDNEGYIVGFNNFSEFFFNYRRDEVIGDRFTSLLVTSEDESLVKETLTRTMKDSASKTSIDFTIQTKSRSKKRMPWNFSSVQAGDSEQFVMLLGTCNEQDRKRNDLRTYEEAIKESEEKYRKLVETAPDAIVLYDYHERKVLDINERACSLFKMPREKLLKIRHKYLTPEFQPSGNHYRESSIKYINEAIEGRNPIFEWTYIDGDGNYIPTKVWLTRLPAKDKILIRASIVDMSEVKKREKQISQFIRQQSELLEAIRSKEERLSALINNSSDLIFSVDKDFRLLEFNKTFSSMTKNYYGKDLRKGDILYEVVSKEHSELGVSNMKRALNGEPSNLTLDIIGKDGCPKHLSVLYSPIISGSNEITGIVVTIRNITESRLAEKKLVEIDMQMAEYKLMALRSVMNPHFLFNSLNSIQCFIARFERKQALDYLSIFSNLIRRVLESSVSQKVRLATEIEILNNYIELEMVRFDRHFSYSIEIDKSIDPELVQIPSLLIQPYVENAILHGLMNQPKEGKLKIALRPEGDHLLIVVEDNGIGRAQAQEIKEKNLMKDQSLGMTLTAQRLEIINKTLDVSVLVDDLHNEDGTPAGTRIKIYLKI